ncbi:SDR family NAD(P)-dependent oxidoreductase [Dysosmobacter sp.]|uniref:SDR family NAD(P)-dependent oxidoreductase n=1 Tax=Dysosmobacter sp. TaxID=2591382 RepID=UPI003A2D7610
MFENEFKGKVVLVTGGSRGIGFAAVKKFLASGAKVCFLSHYEETGAKAMEQLKEINPDYEVMRKVIDLTDFKAIQELYKEIIAKWGRLDVLVNNAGTDSSTWITKLKLSEWNEVNDLNLKAPYLMTKYALPHLLKTKGCVVNTASVAGVYGSPTGLPYPVTKAGVIAMTKSIAYSYADKGVRVNAVAPGVVATDMVANMPQFAKDSIGDTIPMKRFGDPDDIANAMLFLSSSAASYITGVCLQVDGGYRPNNQPK